MKAVYMISMAVLLSAAMGPVGAQDARTGCVVPCEIINLGEGPVPLLQRVPDELFDETYMLTVYQLDSDIAALAAYGLDHACDRTIKAFSRKIAMERIDVKNDLKSWYWQYDNRIMPKPDTSRQEVLIGALQGCCGQEFDTRYAQLMIDLMSKSRDAAELATEETDNLELLFQARVAQRTNENEIQAFERWLDCGTLMLE